MVLRVDMWAVTYSLAFFSSSFKDKCVSEAITIVISFADFNFDGLIRSGNPAGISFYNI